MEQYLVLVVSLLAGAAVVIVSYYGIKYLAIAKQDKVFALILSWAEVLVKSIEQQLDVEGYEKKTVVMLGLKKFCQMAKINVPDEVLDDAIEQAVFTMKQLAKLTPGIEDDAFIEKLTAGLAGMEGAG